MSGLLGSLSTLGYFGVLVSSLILNLIPFVGPSNIVIAGAAGGMFPSLNPFLIGFFIALGASAAKTIHFGISFFAGNFLKRKIKTGKNENESKPISHRYAMIALFLAAATPIPDDPVVISLGLARYSPLRFFLAFFTGKALITIAGAFFGHRFGLTLEKYFGLEGTIIISIVLTIVLTIAIIKKDTILKKFKLFQRSKSQ